MTIREQLARDIGDMLLLVEGLGDDPDIITRLRPELRRVARKLEECVSILTEDNGPTAADIAGEVVHVPAPF